MSTMSFPRSAILNSLAAEAETGGISSVESSQNQSQNGASVKPPVSSLLKSKDKKKAETAGARARDLALVERAKAGDHDAYRQLVEEYQSRAHSIALGILGNYQDAEEVAQEAFVKAYRNLSSFRAQSSFYTWLYRIIFNLSIDLSRKAYRRSEIGVEDGTAIDTLASYSDADSGRYMGSVLDPESEYRRREIRQRFDAALAELSPDHRAVITLREIDGLSYSEISEVVGCTKGTVMSRLHHARKKLQASLQVLRSEEAPAAGDVGAGEEKKKTEVAPGRRSRGAIRN